MDFRHVANLVCKLCDQDKTFIVDRNAPIQKQKCLEGGKEKVERTCFYPVNRHSDYCWYHLKMSEEDRKKLMERREWRRCT